MGAFIVGCIAVGFLLMIAAKFWKFWLALLAILFVITWLSDNQETPQHKPPPHHRNR